jgi:hypothetical protein
MNLSNLKPSAGRIFDLASITLMLFFCVKYPSWFSNGYLDTIYLKVAVAVAAYGGLLGNIVWLYKDIKRRGW